MKLEKWARKNGSRAATLEVSLTRLAVELSMLACLLTAWLPGLLSLLEGILVIFSGENLGLLVKLEINLDLFLPESDASFKLT